MSRGSNPAAVCHIGPLRTLNQPQLITSHCKVINGLLIHGVLQLDNLPVFDETRLEIESRYSFNSRIHFMVKKTPRESESLNILSVARLCSPREV
jgi:hypothetical protein